MANRAEHYTPEYFLNMTAAEADAFEEATKFVAPYFGRVVGALYNGNKRVALPSELYPNGFGGHGSMNEDTQVENYSI